MHAPFGPLPLGLFLAAIAAWYTLLPLASGLSAGFSVLDLCSAAAFWGALGALAGFVGARAFKDWVRQHAILSWTLVACAWALTEAAFTAVVVVKPTRWPSLPYTLVAIGFPAAIAAAFSIWALMRAVRERQVRGVHPALVVVFSWTALAALTLWIPRWLRAFLDAPRVGWFLWGVLDLAWILMSVCAVVLVGAAALGSARRRQQAFTSATVLTALQLLPLAFGHRGATARAAEGSPSIVWIVVDSVRADHSSAYGYTRPTTPSLERLAAQGTLVRSHVATGIRTENTYGKMLSLAPTLDRYDSPVPVPLSSARALLPRAWVPSQPGLISSLRVDGYQTAVFHVYHDLLEDKGLQPWLQAFDDLLPTRLSGDASAGAYVMRMILGRRLDGTPQMDRWGAHRRRFLAENITYEVRKFLEQRHDQRPLFLIVHLAGGHSPFYRFSGSPRLPGAPSVKVGKYDDSLRSADDQVGALLETVGASLPGSALFVFADHGEALEGEPSLPQGSNVPLIVTPPLPQAPAFVTSSLDIVATTLALARVQPPTCDGKLARDLRCSAPPDQVRVVDQTGHGQLILTATVDGSMVAARIASHDAAIGSHPAIVMSPCDFLARTGVSAEDLPISPLETRSGLLAHLRSQLSNCRLPAPSAHR